MEGVEVINIGNVRMRLTQNKLNVKSLHSVGYGGNKVRKKDDSNMDICYEEAVKMIQRVNTRNLNNLQPRVRWDLEIYY